MRPLAAACTLAVALTVMVTAPARAEPTQAELDRAGDRLQAVTEAYNEAKLKRASLDTKLTSARQDQQRSETHLAGEKQRLGKAVRDLYMHPAAGLNTFFQAKSYGELERGTAMAGQLATSTEGLILQIRKARAEYNASTSRLTALRDQARRDELAMAEQQKNAAAAFARTRALLAQSNRSALDAARRAQLSDAPEMAAKLIHFSGKVRPGAAAAVRAAASQIGKPYRWGAAGPDSYDCSGLTMWAWAHGGVSLPHSSRAQYSSLPHVPLSQLAPGDLVFSGSPIHHVAIYKGGGVVVAAPHSGENVREQSVWSLHPVGAARP
jgi:peptidoglycan DL-endopeptidase CwlO